MLFKIFIISIKSLLYSPNEYNDYKINVAPPLRQVTITSIYGYRMHPILKKEIFHSGIDLRADYEDVYSILNGKILAVGSDKKNGKYIKILHHNHIKSIYSHLNRIDVIENQLVSAGERIGESGNTGYSTAPHLHFAIMINDKYYDPLLFFTEILKIKSDQIFTKISTY